MDSVTNEDKLKAINALRTDVGNFITAQEKQETINHKILYHIRIILYTSSFMSLMLLGYIITAPPKASPDTLHYVQKQLLYIDKENQRILKERADISMARTQLKQMVDTLKQQENGKRNSTGREGR